MHNPYIPCEPDNRRLKKLGTSSLRSTRNIKNTRASSRFFIFFVSLGKQCFPSFFWLERFSWLGMRDSNPRMVGPEPTALPLGESPTVMDIISHFFQKVLYYLLICGILLTSLVSDFFDVL